MSEDSPEPLPAGQNEAQAIDLKAQVAAARKALSEGASRMFGAPPQQPRSFKEPPAGEAAVPLPDKPQAAD
jgi:hypothetical protein